MADNVVKFRKIEKKPEKSQQKSSRPPGQPPKWPSWLPWAVIGAIAVLYFVAQSLGVFGR